MDDGRAEALFAEDCAEHARLLESVRRDMREHVAQLGRMCIATIQGGGKILVCGNGGSATQAQHFALELTVRLETERHALPALSLASDAALLTAAGNDFGFEAVFARQIEALGRAPDLVIGISTSGRSANVIAAVETARRLGLATAALTGGDGGRLASLVDLAVVVPSRSTVRVQEIHLVICHSLCAMIERQVRPAPRPASSAGA